MGGYDGSRRNDVWRSDDQGASWIAITSNAGWPARYRHSSVTLLDGSVILTGGFVSSGLNDVWRWKLPVHTIRTRLTSTRCLVYYTVAMQAYDQYGPGGVQKTDYIEVKEPIVAAFSGNPVEGFAPLDLQFTDESTARPPAGPGTSGMRTSQIPGRR